ncbi:hypothetical protein AKO1_010482 [Acrasis kona]|uniref:Uncharacterized protein n=1 Tax=Acrasis kona TaxID=1008807 RepID=A0AAW2ZLD6_9EUKA
MAKRAKDVLCATILAPTKCFSLTRTSIYIKLAVKPGSKQNSIVQIDESSPEMTIKIAAPPVDGEANKEVCEYIATILNTRKSNVTMHSGHKSRNKTIIIEGIGRDGIIKEEDVAWVYDRFKSSCDKD